MDSNDDIDAILLQDGEVLDDFEPQRWEEVQGIIEDMTLIGEEDEMMTPKGKDEDEESSSSFEDELGIASSSPPSKAYFPPSSTLGDNNNYVKKPQYISRRTTMILNRRAEMMKEDTVDPRLKLDNEGFDPLYYLRTEHGTTSTSDLKDGVQKLKHHLEARKEDIKTLVRNNFERFVHCKDTIDVIHSEIVENDVGSSNTSTLKLETTYKSFIESAQEIFQNLLQRKQQADTIRSTLDLLDRFRFLLKLPSTIQEHVNNRDYEKVVQNYQRALTLLENASVQNRIFQKILVEVEDIITAFRAKLFSTLEDPNIHFEEQERVILTLNVLKPKERNQDWKDPMKYFYEHHVARITNAIQRAGCSLESLSNTNIKLLSGKEMIDLNVIRIQNMTDVLLEHLLSFYQLGKYFTSKKQKLAPIASIPGSDGSTDIGHILMSFNNLKITVFLPDNRSVDIYVDPSDRKPAIVAQAVEEFVKKYDLSESSLAHHSLYLGFKKKTKKKKTKLKYKEIDFHHSVDKILHTMKKNVHYPGRFVLKAPEKEGKHLSLPLPHLHSDELPHTPKAFVPQAPTPVNLPEFEFRQLFKSVLLPFVTSAKTIYGEDLDTTLVLEDNGYITLAEDRQQTMVHVIRKVHATLISQGIPDIYLIELEEFGDALLIQFITDICNKMRFINSHQRSPWNNWNLTTEPGTKNDILISPLAITFRDAYSAYYALLIQIRPFFIEKNTNNSPLFKKCSELIASALNDSVNNFMDCIYHAVVSLGREHQEAFENNIRKKEQNTVVTAERQRPSNPRLVLHPTLNISPATLKKKKSTLGINSIDQKSLKKQKEKNKKKSHRLTLEKKLLVCLNNLTFLKEKLCPQLLQLFFKIFATQTTISIDDSMNLLNNLIITAYLRQKSTLLNKIMIVNLYQATPRSLEHALNVSPFIHDLLLQLVFFHAEIISFSPDNIEDFFSAFLENILHTFLDLINMNDSFTAFQVLQLYTNIKFLRQILSHFQTKTTQPLFIALLDTLNHFLDLHDMGDYFNNPDKTKRLSEILDDIGYKKRVVYRCFNSNV